MTADYVQLDLFAVGKEPYEVNDNPMVRKYGLTWLGAKCGVNTRRAKPCKHFDQETGKCLLREREHWKLRGQHNKRWDACGQYQPIKPNEE
jgi:hypothetical protein